ncbi:hypothetical protein VTK73DRAFT_3685 [Phialemonium thermophilum]|uniref:Uncharacterized protein n=1 Tax=Phialemonium thermophilum TaxID=223376 RepID=A0ABR3VH06_9PEZI
MSVSASKIQSLPDPCRLRLCEIAGREYRRGKKSREKRTSLSPGKLPKVIWLAGGGAPEGGRPPLAEGWGMGDGEAAGDGILGLLPGMGMGAAEVGCGVLCEAAGEL